MRDRVLSLHPDFYIYLYPFNIAIIAKIRRFNLSWNKVNYYICLTSLEVASKFRPEGENSIILICKHLALFVYFLLSTNDLLSKNRTDPKTHIFHLYIT